MDPATGIGIGLAILAILASMIMDGGNPMAIILIPSIVLVFGGTIGAAIAGGILRDAKALPKQVIAAVKAKAPTADATVETLVHLAERARREGLLALESETSDIEPLFLRRGLQMAVDGIDAEEVAEILESEIETKRANDKRAAKIFQDMGGYAPTIGIIGTVLGLIHVLGNLSEPSKLGAEIASAFVATLWGVLTANVIWFPMHNRLRRISDLECDQMELVLEGILAIQAGSNPRLVAQKLQSLLPADQPKAKDKDDEREVA
jgi:chemotaxis protein MotA